MGPTLIITHTDPIYPGGKLSNADFRVVAASRNPDVSGRNPAVSGAKVDLISASEREIEDVIRGNQGVVIATGTTAFPTIKWREGNTPKNIDLEATKKILNGIHRVNRELAEDDEGRVKKVRFGEERRTEGWIEAIAAEAATCVTICSSRIQHSAVTNNILLVPSLIAGPPAHLDRHEEEGSVPFCYPQPFPRPRQ